MVSWIKYGHKEYWNGTNKIPLLSYYNCCLKPPSAYVSEVAKRSWTHHESHNLSDQPNPSRSQNKPGRRNYQDPSGKGKGCPTDRLPWIGLDGIFCRAEIPRSLSQTWFNWNQAIGIRYQRDGRNNRFYRRIPVHEFLQLRTRGRGWENIICLP